MIHSQTNSTVERQPLPRPPLWVACLTQAIFPILVIMFFATGRPSLIGEKIILIFVIPFIILLHVKYYTQLH